MKMNPTTAVGLFKPYIGSVHILCCIYFSSLYCICISTS